MGRPMVRDVVASQVALFGFWGVCLLIVPGFLLERDEGGLSNFGVHLDTVVPYTLAFVVCSAFLLRAARRITTTDATCARFRRLLEWLAVLLLLTLASTYGYQHGAALKWIHVGIGAAVVSFEALASLWVAIRLLDGGAWLVVLGAQLAGTALAAATLLGAVHLLFVSQLVTSAAFGILLVAGARRIDATAAALAPTGD